MRKVVVTGLGLVTPLGNDVDQSWQNLINSKSGIKIIKDFDVDDLPCKIAGYINHTDENHPIFDSLKYVEKKDLKKIDRFILYGIAAANQAINDSGITDLSEEVKLKTGVILGSGIGGLETIYNSSINLIKNGTRKISPFFIPSSLINLLSGHVSIRYGFKHYFKLYSC